MGARRSVTLVELMIVVAIIGILAAIAIPNFHRMQLRAKQAEAPVNLDGITTAIDAYKSQSASGEYPMAVWSPSCVPTKDLVPWVPSAGFVSLGWTPDGGVRGRYTSGAA